MHFTTWLLFAGTAFLIGIIPGPGVTTIVGHALSGGRRAAISAVAGMTLGNVACMSLSLAGAGALLAASATAFSILKWAGSAYLIGLGVLTIWRTTKWGEKKIAVPHSEKAQAQKSFWGTFFVALFHPKTLIFFVAFVPAFINKAAPFVPQAALLVATFGAATFLTDMSYALAASGAAKLFRGQTFAAWTKRAGGTAMVGAGIVTATLKAK